MKIVTPESKGYCEVDVVQCCKKSKLVKQGPDFTVSGCTSQTGRKMSPSPPDSNTPDENSNSQNPEDGQDQRDPVKLNVPVVPDKNTSSGCDAFAWLLQIPAEAKKDESYSSMTAAQR